MLANAAHPLLTASHSLIFVFTKDSQCLYATRALNKAFLALAQQG